MGSFVYNVLHNQNIDVIILKFEQICTHSRVAQKDAED